MKVIFHTIDPVEMAILILQNTIHKGVKSAFVFQNHYPLPVTSAVNNVINKPGMCAHKN
jgi:hypothetical protein